MTVKDGVEPRGSASEELRPVFAETFRLLPVPMPVRCMTGWNRRVAAA